MIRGDLESKNKRGTRILVDGGRGGVIETRPVTLIIILIGEDQAVESGWSWPLCKSEDM